MNHNHVIAYFSMEIGIDPNLPTYSGGLGILAGDTLRAAADMNVPLVGVTLLPRKGYFHQEIDLEGNQIEQPEQWDIAAVLQEVPQRTSIEIEGRTVQLRAWKYSIQGARGGRVPVYFLDTNLPENDPADRRLTDHLYGGDLAYRLSQEIVLGIGGLRMLRSIGYANINKYHLNEGHPALLIFELLREKLIQSEQDSILPDHTAEIRRQCVFTTHTPVPAGHDKFPPDLARRLIGPHPAFDIEQELCCDHELNMTYLALNFSGYVNGVAKKHGETSRHMFAPYVIDSITNRIHASFWASQPFQELFDEHIPGWHEDNFSLRYALNISNELIWQTHSECKRRLLDHIRATLSLELDPNLLTLGFARRATAYKRADLLFDDPGRLRAIAQNIGRLQIIYAGKAHPKDQQGKELIRKVIQAARDLQPEVTIVYLPNYDINLARLIIPGVDLWLNTPQPPHEASGTSGMKAALNGVPSLSILDGWWIEGCIEGITGWAIGPERSRKSGRDRHDDARSLYDKLEHTIVPLFYHDRRAYLQIMSHAIALNGSFFNTQRMLQQYVLKAYF